MRCWLAVLLPFFALGCAPDPATTTLAPGDSLPAVTFATLDGTTIDRDALLGQPTVLSFWATWCRPCVHEIPVLNQIHRTGTARVLAVALDDEGARVVSPYVEARGIHYPVALGDEAVFRALDGSTIPYTLVLDDQATVVALYRGPVNQATLDAALDRIEPSGG